VDRTADTPEVAGRPERDAASSGRSRVRRAAERLGSLFRDPGNVLALVFITAFLLRAIWLNVPSQGLIFDEAYYVNAARVIIGLEATSHYADAAPGFDPNTEHPALGKLILAGSMAVLGDNSVAWRLPSVIFGMLALAAVYLIARDRTRRRR
jgi:4-amino-4-deoxy-L-arabinose transferase-like glycosyltransferase